MTSTCVIKKILFFLGKMSNEKKVCVLFFSWNLNKNKWLYVKKVKIYIFFKYECKLIQNKSQTFSIAGIFIVIVNVELIWLVIIIFDWFL